MFTEIEACVNLFFLFFFIKEHEVGPPFMCYILSVSLMQKHFALSCWVADKTNVYILIFGSYVLASYANFLWDAEEDEEDKDCKNKSNHSHTYPTDLFHGANHHIHLTAAIETSPLFLKWRCVTCMTNVSK